MLFKSVLVLALIWPVTEVGQRDRDLKMDEAMVGFCATYVRWTILAQDHVLKMKEFCNLK